jgi:dTDP-4-amino-4,6-dideoxygalactose transaminase
MVETSKKLQMVDLSAQYEKIKDEVNQAILNVVQSSAFINGPEVHAFQADLEQYLGVKHVIPCANGTDALQIAMMALDLQPGDEVIAPSFTFVATAEVIALMGLTPVLVDVNPDTYNIDPDSVRKAITPKTKAIVPVHLFGQCADMDAMMAIAKEHDLYVIEDNAQAIGAIFSGANGSSKKSGTIGHFGTTSFFPSKNLGCFGDGGALFTNDDTFAKKARSISNHGMTVRYYHDHIGINSRLDSIQAAVLRVKLRELDNYCDARREAAAKYDAAFADIQEITTPVRYENSTHVFHQYTMMIESDRDGLKAHMDAMGIPAMIYYPVPLHMQKAYLDTRYNEGDFPTTEILSKKVISLPMHTELNDDQISTITSAVISYFQK